eukprot:scaffold11009_cov103-Isochrysis_galbana.AAC.1
MPEGGGRVGVQQRLHQPLPAMQRGELERRHAVSPHRVDGRAVLQHGVHHRLIAVGAGQHERCGAVGGSGGHVGVVAEKSVHDGLVLGVWVGGVA